MDQLFQIAGAVLILIAFMAAQRGTMSPHSVVYLSLNLVGSIVLTGVALHGEDGASCCWRSCGPPCRPGASCR